MGVAGRLIAEFEHHQGTIAMYPFRTDIWRCNAEYMQKYVIELVQRIAKYEHVYLVCRDTDISTLDYLTKQNITLISIEYNDIWARDIGPTFIEENDEIKCINWKFNSWGGLKEGSYYPWDQDDAFADSIATYFGLESKRVDIVLEGGAILTDGIGTLFTTRSVLLNRNRNPFKSLSYVEEILKKTLYVDKVVWLDQGLALDETNGHIDNIMSIIKPHEVCLAWTDDKNNINYRRVHKAYEILSKQYDCIIHKIPLPSMQFMTLEESRGLTQNNDAIDRNSGDLLPASYLNFYYVNEGVFLPTFGCMEDAIALKVFKDIFKDRKIEQVYSREPLLGGGGIHCILHEIPYLR